VGITLEFSGGDLEVGKGVILRSRLKVEIPILERQLKKCSRYRPVAAQRVGRGIALLS